MTGQPQTNPLPSPPPAAIARLLAEQNIWFGSVRADGRPHLAPIWFVYLENRMYVGIDTASVKGRNITANPHVVLALEGGDHPVICEGTARFLPRPYEPALLAAFAQKYEWDLEKDSVENHVVEITPRKWLSW
jgi:F420H(2)-dependent biliverdin reductase